MSAPLLATKLYLPPPRPNAVPRPRLVERLNAGLQRNLTLLAAPAGSGKTTLLGEWVARNQRPTAWLSLDAADSDLTRFLTYLVAAVQTIAPSVGTGVVGVLQAPQPPPAEAILTALLNDLAAVADPCVLVLDDYHVIEARPVDAALTFLLEHLPPRMHLLIATREDPQLPLARLRVRGQLTELRAADLRFTPAEAAAFLTEVMGLDLAADDIAALEARTEGWIAGLQLAALSLQGHQDASAFIRAFTGDHRYVVDYLVEEVLARQPDHVRDFLLQTSILDRLHGPLCAAVTGQEDGAARLEALHRGNFFVVPLDDRRRWYRYHHLFADVLSTYLMAEQPELVALLHRRASVWYEQHGATADAIRHALAAADFARAADLVEPALPAMRRSRQDAVLLGWFTALPDALIRSRPVLGVVYAHVLLAGGELAGVEDRLRDAERWLDPHAQPHPRETHLEATMVVVDQEAFRRLPGEIAVARAGIALAQGDVPRSVAQARRVLDLVPSDDHFPRGAASAFLGLAAWPSGDLETAYRLYADGMAHLQAAGNLPDVIGGAITLADLRIAQGRLHDAMRIYERGLALATEPDSGGSRPVLRGAADMHVGLSMLFYEHGDLRAAGEHLLHSEDLGEHLGFPQHPYRRRVAMARILQAEGDLEGALELLDAADSRYVPNFLPNVRPVAALKARVWIAQGRVGDAVDWTRERGLSAADELSYLREFEHLTLTRVFLARYQRDRDDRSLYAALGLLDRLLHAAEQGERTGSVLEILVVQALAHQARGDLPAGLVPLQRALALAEPEGYVRLFVDEGPPMADLLRAAAAHGIMPAYMGKLLGVLGVEPPRSGDEGPLPTAPASPPLIEPLSERELDVLRLFTTELSGPEIARELMIALSTVRTHSKSIFSKLHVTNRRAAVKRAAELHLL